MIFALWVILMGVNSFKETKTGTSANGKSIHDVAGERSILLEIQKWKGAAFNSSVILKDSYVVNSSVGEENTYDDVFRSSKFFPPN